MKRVLITGANRGIGLETARQMLKNGYYVYLGSRKMASGQGAVDKLKAEGLTNLEAVQIDVSDSESIKTAHDKIGQNIDALDVLINNAGITGPWPQTSDADISVFKDVYATNFFGTVQVTQVFLDLLKESTEPRIVNVSSSLASMNLHNNPNWKFYQAKGAVYNSSKTALNMYTIHLAYDLRETRFKINLVDPGFVATDMNNFTGTDSVMVAAARVIKIAMMDSTGPTGKFFSEDIDPENALCPW
ncbi:MAG: SDR family NAD(P)-dependent oxidoreductase [Chryseobacterium sp.]|nr:MAG: SDR family NAD(P)-dependent oxidoreductase [Chryseobacterium sp.]